MAVSKLPALADRLGRRLVRSGGLGVGRVNGSGRDYGEALGWVCGARGVEWRRAQRFQG